jgi:hypothetical protein
MVHRNATRDVGNVGHQPPRALWGGTALYLSGIWTLIQRRILKSYRKHCRMSHFLRHGGHDGASLPHTAEESPKNIADEA